MNLLIVIVLSVTQGVTEFLPISSSAHLLLLPWLLNWPDPGLAFDAATHIGTALALIVFFYKDFWRLYKEKQPLLWYILIASVPAAILGFIGSDLIDKYLHKSAAAPLIVGIGLMFFGLVLYVIDKTAKLEKNLEKMKLSDSLIIGFAQALALIPGTSRSGVTISAGLLLGYSREEAARFSFLLATPISLGAGAYSLLSIIKDPAATRSESITLTVVGIVVSFMVGLAVIKWLLDYLRKHSMLVFVVYRVIIGLGVVVIWLVRR
ncbi:undecaprenyl-diphosphate phosphatase [Candidatus Saccharibacteria bacterium]|nr:undecaprenyl-diphosphate phosphatase [Candidatus Saccharibacteria bacterium]